MLKLLFTALLLTVSHGHDYKIGDLKIDHPFVRLPPAGAKVAAGFMTITNSGANDRLIGVETAISAKSEIHEMKHDGGVMVMRELPSGLAIKQGETLVLKSGSYHVMFIGLKAELNAGDKQKATLIFEKAGKIEVEFNVEKMGGHHHHAH
jgi:periplasmic copper chaperone A